jgi:hypothetical protein
MTGRRANGRCKLYVDLQTLRSHTQIRILIWNVFKKVDLYINIVGSLPITFLIVLFSPSFFSFQSFSFSLGLTCGGFIRSLQNRLLFVSH